MAVTSVGLSDGSTIPIYTISGSPVTAAGTLSFTFKTQAANTVLAGPSSGVAAQPSFRALTTSDIPALGVYSATFQSGYLQYIGSAGTITGNTNFLVGLKLPSPLGGTVPGLLIGSGVPNAVIITDTVVGSTTPGINLAIAAGETADVSTAAGGTLTLLGGAAASGGGGTATLQGGTSASGNGGDAIVQAGNASTAGNSGNIYLVGGTATGTNKNGGSITLAMSAATGTGTPGYLNIKSGSTTLYTITNTGAIFIGGTTPGTAGQVVTLRDEHCDRYDFGSCHLLCNCNDGELRAVQRVQNDLHGQRDHGSNHVKPQRWADPQVVHHSGCNRWPDDDVAHKFQVARGYQGRLEHCSQRC